MAAKAAAASLGRRETVRPSRFVRTLAHAAAVLFALVGLAFGVQAAFLNVPSSAQLLAVAALKALARYRVMGSTEQFSARPLRSLCLESRIFDRKTKSFVLGSFVLVGNRQRYYDLGQGVHTVGRAGSSHTVARSQFLLAGCPEFLAQRLGSLLQKRQVRVAEVRTDGVSAYRFHFGQPKRGIELYVERSTLRPLELALGPGVSATRSELEPTGFANQAELIARVVPTSLRSRLLRG